MRIALALPLLLLGACQVSKDDANDTTSVTYNGDVAENAAADIGNAAQNIGADIGNDRRSETGDKISNTVGDVDVDVDADVDTNATTSALSPLSILKDGRGDRIRTCDPLLPKQTRYQAAPLPD